MGKHFRPPWPIRNLAFAVLLSCCVSARPAPAQSLQAENKPAESIRGMVVNGVTHEPIGRALVYSPDSDDY